MSTEDEKVPQHSEEGKGFDPLPKAAGEPEPDYDAPETDEVEVEVDPIPEEELEDAADAPEKEETE